MGQAEPAAPEWQCAAVMVNIAYVCERALRLGYLGLEDPP